jgi:hypothetical protein
MTASAGKPIEANKPPSATLTFIPARDTTDDEAVGALKAKSKREADDTAKSDEEGGGKRAACWRTDASITTIESGFPIEKGTIVTVTARDVDPCARP